MPTIRELQIKTCFLLPLSLLVLCFPAAAADPGTIRGRVTDPLGAVVPGATISLLQESRVISTAATDLAGRFEFSAVKAGRYHLRSEAKGFSLSDVGPVILASGGTASVEVPLQIGPLKQEIVVTDTGTDLPESQTGASVTVLDSEELRDAGKLDVLETLRLVPGLQVVQTSQRGGTTSVFVRGGNQEFNKVLVDGIPADDIGGNFEFANLAASGVESVEILRGPNSVLYGSDPLSSVIDVTTRRGISTVPELTFSSDGGNFHTLRQDGTLAGALRRFDYFSEFSRLDTKNSVPNSAFHNGTYAGNFGWIPQPSTSVRFTVRRTAAAVGLPAALYLYGIPDDSSQGEHDTFLGLTAQSQTTTRWHNLVRLASTRIRYHFINPSPTGAPFDPFGLGPNYLGNTVTICGANGYCTTGQAILDFAASYPQTFDASTNRRFVYGQSDYQFHPDFTASIGFRYEHANGFVSSGGSPSAAIRDNYGTFLETHGSLRRRIYATAGVGFEHNAVFGFAATPRVSLAYYLRRPSQDSLLGETKLRFNFGKGIEEPTILNAASSLFGLLSQTPGGQSLISQYGISPNGPERSRSFDFGFEQGLWSGRARLRATFFHNRYYDLIEFVDQGALLKLGVPPSVAAEALFGATVSTLAYRALGAETELEVRLTRQLRVKGQYTYLDAVVTRSFSSDNISPAVNPAFPTIPIGGFSPLVGARPFLRAPHSGSLFVDYTRRKINVALSGYFVSRQDDSTFLLDGFFGSTMLLPNRNLNAGYQKFDVSARYSANSVVTFYSGVENLLDQRYQAAFGYPALPLTFRSGLKFTLGGEKGWWKWQ